MTKIYYFSGTGNTLWSAKKLSELIGGETELINIGMAIQKDDKVLEADAIILLFPSYAYGAPIIVNRFVRQAVFKTGYIAVFVTYGSAQGGALAEIGRILKRKKTGPVFFGRIPSVENYIPIFGVQKKQTIERRLLLQKKSTDEAAHSVINRRTNRINTFRPISAFISFLFSLGIKIFRKWYRVSDECNGCGVCEKTCPVSAIIIQNKRPVFGDKCQHCNGCLNWCPRQAIQFGRIKAETPRYHHPEINITEISR